LIASFKSKSVPMTFPFFGYLAPLSKIKIERNAKHATNRIETSFGIKGKIDSGKTMESAP
ncbi:MAG: hypothetical protein IIY32_06125, partial [Thermoguttaceae bacterium]|nr:hypothetical protein [Thermoguttaceae bacterium]